MISLVKKDCHYYTQVILFLVAKLHLLWYPKQLWFYVKADKHTQEREIVRGTSVIQLGSRLSLSYLYTQEERLHFVAAHGSVHYLNSHPLSSRAQIK